MMKRNCNQNIKTKVIIIVHLFLAVTSILVHAKSGSIGGGGFNHKLNKSIICNDVMSQEELIGSSHDAKEKSHFSNSALLPNVLLVGTPKEGTTSVSHTLFFCQAEHSQSKQVFQTL